MGFSDRFRELWNSEGFEDDYDEDDYDEYENDSDYIYNTQDERPRRNRKHSAERNTGKRKYTNRRRTRSSEEELEDDFMNRYTGSSSSQHSSDSSYGSYGSNVGSYDNYSYHSSSSSDYHSADNNYGSTRNSSDYRSADSGYSSSSSSDYDYGSSGSASQGNYDYGSSSASYSSDRKFFDINATTKLRVVCVKPQSYGNDIKYIADQLIENYTILLNFEETPKNEIRSIIDFISGCAYVKHGKVQRIAKNIFIVTPDNVELKGDSLIGELANNGLLIIE